MNPLARIMTTGIINKNNVVVFLPSRSVMRANKHIAMPKDADLWKKNDKAITHIPTIIDIDLLENTGL